MNKMSNTGYRPTWAEIKLDNLSYNFKRIKDIVGPKVKVMACVKADAYGHGLIPVAMRLVSLGADYLGVASIDEGIRLRRKNIRIPILILGMAMEKDAEILMRYDLAPTVCTQDLASALNRAAAQKRRVLKIHIKVDTGMGRIGVLSGQALDYIRKVSALKSIKIEGVFTHFSCADTDKHFTLQQINIFKKIIADLDSCGIYIPFVHSANSVGIMDYKESHFNMVRPGLALYGLYPAPARRGGVYAKEEARVRLKPVLSLKTRVAYLKRAPKGWGISYGRSYVTRKAATIITLPIGYGDGYPRNLSGCGPVLIKKRRFHIAGRVCMDQVMVDVGDTPVKIGDEAVLIGSQGKEVITVEELAGLSQTISYEIVCGLGSRIPRVYI